MRPVLIERGGVRIWSYPALLYTGLVAGIAAQNYAAHIAGFDGARIWIATLLLLPTALLGARSFYVATHWDVFRADLGRVWNRSQGGLAMYGAVPMMLGGSVPVLAVLGIPFWEFWDVSVFCILVGMIFARVGCLLQGCCSGCVTGARFGVWLSDQRGVRARRIPAQLLEAGLGAVLLAVAIAVWPAVQFHGELFLGTAAGYGIGRVALQAARENRTLIGGVDLQQVISASLGIAAIVLLMVRL